MNVIRLKPTRELVIDRLALIMRKPRAEPLVTPEEVIAVALSAFVPGPADLISPTGRGVRTIMLLLKKMGYKIVPMEREDYDGSER
jgi:hypothetical protein